MDGYGRLVLTDQREKLKAINYAFMCAGWNSRMVRTPTFTAETNRRAMLTNNFANTTANWELG